MYVFNSAWYGLEGSDEKGWTYTRVKQPFPILPRELRLDSSQKYKISKELSDTIFLKIRKFNWSLWQVFFYLAIGVMLVARVELGLILLLIFIWTIIYNVKKKKFLDDLFQWVKSQKKINKIQE